MCKLSLKACMDTEIAEFITSAQGVKGSMVLLMAMAFYNEGIVFFISFKSFAGNTKDIMTL